MDYGEVCERMTLSFRLDFFFCRCLKSLKILNDAERAPLRSSDILIISDTLAPSHQARAVDLQN